MISLIIFKANVMVKENLIKQDQTEFLINKSVKDFNNNTKIYRYMDFDCFLQILDKQFYVSTKKQFADCYDAGKKIPINDISKNFLMVCGEKQTNLKQYTVSEISEAFKNSQNYLASCWTLSKDNILMWQAYTHGNCGICIESTIGNVIASLDSKSINPYLICCSPMYYNGYSNLTEVEEILFKKLNIYRGEDEIRFYFLSGKVKSNTKDLDAIAKNNVFKIKPEVLIDNVFLSPFMRGNSAKLLKGNLEECYDFLKGHIKISELSSQYLIL